MKRITKKLTVVLLLLLLVSFCLFAEAVSFKIAHAINVSSDFYFEFQKPETSAPFPNATVSFASAGEYQFAKLAFVLRAGTVFFSTVEIQVSDLVHTEESDKYLDFIFRVYEANNTAVPIPFVADPDKHGAGSSELKTNWTPASGSDEIAEFWITIDDTNAMVGTYQGTLRVIITD